MITENNIKTLDLIVAKYAMEDYRVTNPDTPAERKRRHRKRLRGESPNNPYCLSEKTLEASKMLCLARLGKDEETVKAYLLKHKLLGR